MCNQNSCFGGGSCCWIIIAIILIIVVVVALVGIFRTQLTEIVTGLFKQIRDQLGV